MREARDPINQLRNAIDCLPRSTREAMLHGVRTNPIIAGAYTDNHGGICPMLAAHRNGGRTDYIPFSRAWDAFTHAGRARRATRRELRVLEDLLEASLETPEEVDLRAAIAAHQAARRRRVEAEARGPEREYGDIVARRLRPGAAKVRDLRDAEGALERFLEERRRAEAGGPPPLW